LGRDVAVQPVGGHPANFQPASRLRCRKIERFWDRNMSRDFGAVVADERYAQRGFHDFASWLSRA
jgi:hypothetical protein